MLRASVVLVAALVAASVWSSSARVPSIWQAPLEQEQELEPAAAVPSQKRFAEVRESAEDTAAVEEAAEIAEVTKADDAAEDQEAAEVEEVTQAEGEVAAGDAAEDEGAASDAESAEGDVAAEDADASEAGSQEVAEAEAEAKMDPITASTILVLKLVGAVAGGFAEMVRA